MDAILSSLTVAVELCRSITKYCNTVKQFDSFESSPPELFTGVRGDLEIYQDEKISRRKEEKQHLVDVSASLSKRFRSTARLLLRILEKRTRGGLVVPHLSDLLFRMNFNSYYSNEF